MQAQTNTMLPVDIESRREEIGREVESLGAEIVDLFVRRGHQRSTLIVLADKAGGITLEDCARVNRHLNGFLERTPGLETYEVEVSSPGLDRPLKTEKDFLRAKGQRIKVHYKNEAGAQMTVAGLVFAASSDDVELQGDRGEILRIGLTSIFRAVKEIRFR